jgi:DNA-binding MarR family transcriptional regulator
MIADSNYVPLSAREYAAWGGFLFVHAAVLRELDRRLEEEHGLSVRWYDVLATLDEAPERRLRMSELAQNVVLSPSRLTRLVDRLERDGLVERVADERDARGAYAALTPLGLRRLREARRTHHEVVRGRFLDRLSASEQDALARCWRRMLRRP